MASEASENSPDLEPSSGWVQKVQEDLLLFQNLWILKSSGPKSADIAGPLVYSNIPSSMSKTFSLWPQKVGRSHGQITGQQILVEH